MGLEVGDQHLEGIGIAVDGVVIIVTHGLLGDGVIGLLGLGYCFFSLGWKSEVLPVSWKHHV
jgi:hypothetical protein